MLYVLPFPFGICPGGLVASRLRVLPEFAGTCRLSLLIFFRISGLGTTHNSLVAGSSPAGPTDQPDFGQGIHRRAISRFCGSGANLSP